MTLLLIVLLVLAIALVAFAIYNPTLVTVFVPFFGTEFQMSISLLVTLSAAIGAIGAGSVGLLRVVSLRVQMWNAEGKAKRAERDLERAQKDLEAAEARFEAAVASAAEAKRPESERPDPGATQDDVET